MRWGRGSRVPVLPCHSLRSTWIFAGKDFFLSNRLGDKGQTVSLKVCPGNEWVELVVLEKKEKITSRGTNNMTRFSQTVTLFAA